MRGTFGNIRIKNRLVPSTEGGYTCYEPSGETMFIYDAAMKYAESGTPLIILAGKEYGSGSSRDWAAKGPALLGIKAVVAESYERIHRSNLIGMGVLPLQFKQGESAESLGLTGHETFSIERVTRAGQHVGVTATDKSGAVKRFEVIARIDTHIEYEYFENGGLVDCIGGKAGRDEDYGAGRTGFLNCLFDAVENRHPRNLLPPLARSDAADDPRAVLEH